MSTDREVRTQPDQPIDPDLSLGELFGRLGNDLGELLSSQVDLARTELKAEAREVGQTAGAFGAAALLGYLALTLACFAAAWGLAELMPEGLAFLIVAVVVGIVAGVLAMRGRAQLEEARKVAPKTVGTIKEDVEWTREQVS
ncbi:phage holin family protein [Dermatobacter hominis]|uniref:phage holin family protein n=1 Tax=Dermatobacter hominis TaxID=2884263 RepID=UPI001D100073|nr:phage holin family protein [Dermatobacter hominis]UDY37500.1 phage holin family protein [Dermatobacter hominis]